MKKIKAIQTEYKGYLFRSRLEARWAVFFDFCGIDYEYEPEGYDLGNGLTYLPDFLLHGVDGRSGGDLYVEVKGSFITASGIGILVNPRLANEASYWSFLSLSFAATLSIIRCEPFSRTVDLII